MVDIIYVGLTNEGCNMHGKSGDASFSICNNTHSKDLGPMAMETQRVIVPKISIVKVYMVTTPTIPS